MSRRLISIDNDYPSGLDFAGLLAALVCSEQVVLESPRLDDVIPLTQKFGPEGVQALFHSGRVKCLSEVTQPFAADPEAAVVDGSRSSTSQTDRIRLGFLTQHDPQELVEQGIEQIHQIEGLTDADRSDIAAAVAPHVIAEGSSGVILPQLVAQDLGIAGPALKAAILTEAAYRTGRPIDQSAFKVEISRFDNVGGTDLIEVRSNIGVMLGLSMREAFNLVQTAVLSVAAFDYRLEQGNRLDALPEFRPNHVPLLDAKTHALMAQIDEATRKEKLIRVARIAGIPSVSNDPRIQDLDIGRLLALCESDEIVLFRHWLDGSGELSDEEIEKETTSLFDRVAVAVEGPVPRTVREFVTVIGGLVLQGPGALALAAADKVLFGAIGKPGPAASIRKLKGSVG